MPTDFKNALDSFRHLKEAAKPRVVRSALNAALQEGVKAARDNAPVGDEPHKTYRGRLVVGGFLKRNIKKSTRVSKDKKEVVGNIRLSREAFYGSFIEFGFKSKGPRPWFFPAVNAVEPRMFRRYQTKMIERIEKEFRK